MEPHHTRLPSFLSPSPVGFDRFDVAHQVLSETNPEDLPGGRERERHARRQQVEAAFAAGARCHFPPVGVSKGATFELGETPRFKNGVVAETKSSLNGAE